MEKWLIVMWNLYYLEYKPVAMCESHNLPHTKTLYLRPLTVTCGLPTFFQGDPLLL